MWIYPNQSRFAPKTHAANTDNPEYRRGLTDALSAIRDAVRPDAPLAQTFVAIVRSIFAEFNLPDGLESPNART